MRRFEKSEDPASERTPAAGAFSILSVRAVLAIVRRNALLIALGGLSGLAYGAYQIISAVPSYNATATLLVEHRKVRALQESYAFSTEESSEADLGAQAEILKSDSVLAMLTDRLHPLQEPAIQPTMSARLAQLLQPLSLKFGMLAPESRPAAPPVLDPVSARRRTYFDLKSGLSFRRVPRAALLEISFRASTAGEAARVANAFANAFIDDQVVQQREAAARATDWLQEQLAEMKKSVLESEEAIQRFRVANRLAAPPTGQGAQPMTVEDQRLIETHKQLVLASTEREKLQARYAKLREITNNKWTDAVISESFNDALIAQYRTKYIALLNGERELTKRLGTTHEAVGRLRSEKASYEQTMFKELERIAETYGTEIQIAQSREASLAKEIQAQTVSQNSSNAVLIELRELERRNASLMTLYNGLLQRHQTAMQNQSFTPKPARILTAAQVPSFKDGPATSRILAFTMLLGLAAGGGIGLLRELADRTFRTRRQIHTEFGISSTWFLPRLPAAHFRRSDGQAILDGQGAFVGARGRVEGRFSRAVPAGLFVEQLELMKVDLDRMLTGQSSRIVGVLSAFDGEGVTTVASRLGSFMAQTGAKVLLIDADLKMAGWSKQCAPDAVTGIFEAAQNVGALEDYLVTQPGSGLKILPVAGDFSATHTAHFLASAEMQALLKKAATLFTYVLVDLPAVNRGADVHAIAPHLDAALLVVEWGQASRADIREKLEKEDVLAGKYLGAVLNKAPPRQMKSYELLNG